jgi:hypothetical protein
MADDWETTHFENLTVSNGAGDADGDNLTDLEEFQNDTDPNAVDSDGDNLTDKFEVDNGLNPNLVDSDSNGTNDDAEDPDGDHYNNLAEQNFGTDPFDGADAPVIPGDVNADTVVDLTDAVLALQVMSGLDSAEVAGTGDANGDSAIGPAELIYILQSHSGRR